MNVQSYLVLFVVLTLAAGVAWWRFGPRRRRRLPGCCGGSACSNCAQKSC